MEAGGYSNDDPQFELHARRVITLVESGALERQGNLRRAVWLFQTAPCRENATTTGC
jgi:hypothetical protein